jgi:hypothetical protein
MARAMVREFGERITALVINWPRLGVDAYENRLDIEGFRYAGDSSRDDELWSVWQANNCDEQAQQGHLESLALSRSYVAVGSGDADGRSAAGDDRAPAAGVRRPGSAHAAGPDGHQAVDRAGRLAVGDAVPAGLDRHYRQTDRGWVSTAAG